MHKKIILAICGICLISTSVFAAEQLSWDKLNVQPDIDQKAMGDINNTFLRFCNNGTTANNLQLFLSSRPGKTQKICTVFFNNQETDTNFFIWFSEAKKNSYGERLCDDDSTNNAFSKLIREDYAAAPIFIKAHESMKKTFTITIPKDATGYVIGCLAYNIDSSYSKSTGSVFGIMIRKVAPIQITVTWNVYQFWWRDDLKDACITNKNGILKVLIAVLALRLVVTIVKTAGTKKKEVHHKKK